MAGVDSIVLHLQSFKCSYYQQQEVSFPVTGRNLKQPKIVRVVGDPQRIQGGGYVPSSQGTLPIMF